MHRPARRARRKAAMFGVALLVGACAWLGGEDESDVEEGGDRMCTLAQLWTVGDAYDNEELQLQVSGEGRRVWNDRHGEAARESFRWRSDGESIAFRFDDGREVVVDYALERRTSDCVLRFARAPSSRWSRVWYGSARGSSGAVR